jgi:HPt (histidine-containing phosphotransfer) domain-containing protein
MSTPLDLAALEALLDDAGRDMAPRLLRVFLDDTAQQIERAMAAAHADDRKTLGVIAHSLKSSAATFAAPDVARAARDLEANAAAAEGHAILDKLLDLQCKFALTREAMELKLVSLEAS